MCKLGIFIALSAKSCKLGKLKLKIRKNGSIFRKMKSMTNKIECRKNIAKKDNKKVKIKHKIRSQKNNIFNAKLAKHK